MKVCDDMDTIATTNIDGLRPYVVEFYGPDITPQTREMVLAPTSEDARDQGRVRAKRLHPKATAFVFGMLSASGQLVDAA